MFDIVLMPCIRYRDAALRRGTNGPVEQKSRGRGTFVFRGVIYARAQLI